jgi:hypothetical protein
VPDFDALTPVSTGRTAGLNPQVAGLTNDFGIRFTGYISVPADGQYTFSLTDDSGAQLWLHEVHLIDDDFNHDGAEVSARVYLQAGWHPLRVFYRHGVGPQHLDLEYSGPGISKQPIPLWGLNGG